ncbi:DUF2388 domain-containing protein [Pseudomonas sp. NPDC087612]|uniref:DUF2388 domain-containing protein n=1 Tax=unclassified Pseudomonas TaxID=196821 RepID=UPI0016A48C78|nr:MULTISPECIES: DUF2388 domain-containing protein [unclassified Pseudomonas]NLU59571.1 DUF2388 domain-containing protein [Pseudomonas sp. BIGb0427]QPG64617.1 DUF2388 domain-containing protein [Pseudomonas sp. BIGb0427]QVM96638.1 DUF2388 domain-containing protein [Pseudomonas sp. SORT22]UVL61789.1 DUF2388 domain-containing protein [Pseudomonas sp. B21-032]UVM56102.1 DUF2388 domain-containing protein [Pseudomonas sp. B21-012]
MRYLSLLLLVVCWSSAAQALDLTTNNLVVSGYVTSKVTSVPFDRKLLLAAHDDAAAFVASDGRWRGARLEAALQQLRQANPELHASDLELAQAILVQ